MKIALEKDIGLFPPRSTFDIEGAGPLTRQSMEKIADDPTAHLIPAWAHFLRQIHLKSYDDKKTVKALAIMAAKALALESHPVT